MEALIVEDETDIGLIVKRILQSLGLSSDRAESLEEARGLMSENDYELYLLDLNLEDGSGFDLIEEIRSINMNSKVIIISAYDSDSELQKAKELDVNDFISKPFTKKQVIESIEKVKSS